MVVKTSRSFQFGHAHLGLRWTLKARGLAGWLYMCQLGISVEGTSGHLVMPHPQWGFDIAIEVNSPTHWAFPHAHLQWAWGYAITLTSAQTHPSCTFGYLQCHFKATIQLIFRGHHLHCDTGKRS